MHLNVQQTLKQTGVLSVLILLAVGASFLAQRVGKEDALFGICRGCNVLVIGVDTLRADRVGALGYERNITPAIDSLAKEGYLFSQAIAPASWTVPSFMSVMTGTDPSVHGVVNKYTVFTEEVERLSNLKESAPGIQTLAEVLKDNGYATGGFTGDAGVSGKFGYSLGFDTYTDEMAFGGFKDSGAHALSWADKLNGKKFFMFFHGYDLHGQFAPQEKNPFINPAYRGEYTGSAKEEAVLREGVLTQQGISLSPSDVEFWESIYDGKLKNADMQLGMFLSEMSSRGLLVKTLIVVVSDHGEEFYEHGGFDHGHALYDELIRVPLLIKVPGMKGGVIIPAQVGTIDVMPTVLFLLGIREGGSLNRQLAGRVNLATYLYAPQTPGYDVFSETNYRGYTYKRSIRSADGWKYLLTLESGKEELYNIRNDYKEKTNLVFVDTEKAQSLRERLRLHMERDLRADLRVRVERTCLPVYPGECL